MAELGLAIAGVAATGAALSKALFGIYHSARDSFRDAKDVATHLQLLKSILLELRRTLRRTDGVCSENAYATIRQLLDACEQTFDQIEDIIEPYLPPNKSRDPSNGLGRRVAWHFRKDTIRLLTARLESLKSTIHLMVSIIALANKLPQAEYEHGDEEVLSTPLITSLSFASELVTSEKARLANLCVVEEQVFRGGRINSTHEEVSITPDTQTSPQFARISAWLSDVVWSSQSRSDNSAALSSRSVRSSIALSVRQRWVTGIATNDVEMLLDK